MSIFEEAEICQFSMDLLESVGSADASCSDTGWTKDMITKMMSSEPPKLAFNGESRYLTSLWVFGNREDLSRSESTQSANTSGGCELRADNIAPHTQKLQDKIKAALKLLTFREQHILVQFWSPQAIGKHQQLTTISQPFGLGVIDERLYSYRRDSERKLYVVDNNHKEEDLSPPVRVYRRGLPEWTTDLTNYLPKHFPQQEFALQCNLHGYLALPVLDSSTGSCLGVLELLTSSKYKSYAFEVRQVFSALKTTDLTTTQAFDRPTLYVHNELMNNELEKIFTILKVVCEIHRLPLAQTWTMSPFSSFASHEQMLKTSCNSYDRRCLGKTCLSTAALPFHVQDLGLWPFRKACKELHLDKSCSFVGQALFSRGSCFCEDVTKLSEEEYPLVHYAHINGLTSCFAIYLHSVESNGDYVLEFFLPLNMEDGRHVQILNLVHTLKHYIKIASGFELGDKSPIQVVGPLMDLSSNIDPDIISTSLCTVDDVATDSSYENPRVTRSNLAVLDECSSTKVNSEKRYVASTDLGKRKKRKRGLDTMLKVKATYGEDIEKFRFPISLGLWKLKIEVAKRFNLNSKMICLKYWDEDNDFILFSGNEDFEYAKVASGGNNRINLICELSS
ncbi:NIN-like protein [Tanacetum coccineum]